MSKIILAALILFSFFTGCSKKRDELSEIKIEQVNPPVQTKSEPPQEVRIEDQVQQEEKGSSKPESISITSKTARKNIGKNGIVTGYVGDVFKNPKVAYLNFDGKFPKNSFSAVVFKDEFSKFGDLNRFRGKTVEISGTITEYKGKPQIILKNTSQVKIVN